MAQYDGVVLVAGATGGVGRRVVEFLRREGIQTRALVRDRSKAASLEKLGVELFQVDLTSPDALKSLLPALQGVKAVISALGTRQPFNPNRGLRETDYLGTRRLVDAAKAAGVDHFILVSTMGVRQHASVLHPLSLLFHPKWQAEAYLVRSGLTYTVIRPGGLVDSDEAFKQAPGYRHTPALALARLDGEGGFQVLGRVHRQDVAEAMVKSLWTPATRNRIFDILDRSSIKPKAQGKILKDLF
ncbi:MAG TPA: SDR family oxidoreductase [Chloroflexia bacterium]|nr:SDR family oxidoreductase [Chloroflexia bacterium]